MCIKRLSLWSLYDLFLNHHRSDVKKIFANPLYNCLVSCGFGFFFLHKLEMEQEFKITPQIELTIQLAHLNIVILSPTYVGFEWCLYELAFMVRLVMHRQRRKCTN